MTKTGDIERLVHLKLSCFNPPGSLIGAEKTLFGLQDRKQQLHPGQLQSDGSLLFEFDISVVLTDESKQVRFRGPFAHGTPAIPFLYLSLKRSEGEPPGWIKRLKIPLLTLRWEQLEGYKDSFCFVGKVSGTSSGTVPLLDGSWLLQSC